MTVLTAMQKTVTNVLQRKKKCDKWLRQQLIQFHFKIIKVLRQRSKKMAREIMNDKLGGNVGIFSVNYAVKIFVVKLSSSEKQSFK